MLKKVMSALKNRLNRNYFQFDIEGKGFHPAIGYFIIAKTEKTGSIALTINRRRYNKAGLTGRCLVKFSDITSLEVSRIKWI